MHVEVPLAVERGGDLEAHALDVVDGVRPLRVGFAGEADDDVGRDGDIGDRRARRVSRRSEEESCAAE